MVDRHGRMIYVDLDGKPHTDEQLDMYFFSLVKEEDGVVMKMSWHKGSKDTPNTERIQDMIDTVGCSSLELSVDLTLDQLKKLRKATDVAIAEYSSD